MDCSAIVLNKLLLEKNLDIWAKLKLSFLDPAYSSIYSAISRYYNKYNSIPSFDELELIIREGPSKKTLAVIKLIDEPDIDADVALDALIDQFTQNQTINLLDKFLDKLPVYDSTEIKENLSNIIITLDEKTLTTEGVYSMSDIMLFKNDAEISRDRVHLGLNNKFDSILSGVAREELILIGGKRGSGKSITASNIVINQYEAGFCSVYFSIEMVAHEILERNLSILANVSHNKIKTNSLTNDELFKVIRARAEMFEDSDDLVKDYLKHKDRFKFESTLVRDKKLKSNQMIIIDDRALTVTAIDLHLGKLKARFGDQLTVCVVDYLNQIVTDNTNQYDWQPQVMVSKKLKDLARKHKVVVISPYQIDASGEARFAKGILDAADIALVLDTDKRDDGIITFETTKIRSGPPMVFTSPIDWNSLRISSNDIETPTKKEKIKRATKQVVEGVSDIPPWDT